jgi:hypothetical protein
MRLLGLLVLLTLSAASLPALEKVPAAVTRDRATSSLDQTSTKPLVAFSLRGRRDPFMAYALMTATANTDYLSIASLVFSGLVQVQEQAVGLFRDPAGRTYSLKGGKLYGPQDKAVAGIQGRIDKDQRVALVQGERKINFTAKSTSKRLDEASPR